MCFFYRFLIIWLVFVLSGGTTLKSPRNALQSKIKQSRVVLVGETHTNKAHHENQLVIIKKAHKFWNEKTAIGLEMIQQPFQIYLNQYIQGEIDESKMLPSVEWDKRWRYDFSLYRPIFEYAKENKIPLIALNIPQEITRKIAKSGIQGLNKKERQFLPKTIDTSRTRYRNRLKSIFKQHLHGKNFKPKAFDRFVAAQLAWDEGMAFAASNYLKKHPNKKIVILAGSGHLEYRDGIPSRIDRLLPTRSLVILNKDEKKPDSNKADAFLPYRAKTLK